MVMAGGSGLETDIWGKTPTILAAQWAEWHGGKLSIVPCYSAEPKRDKSDINERGPNALDDAKLVIFGAADTIIALVRQ
jgi:hypothetical protein